MKKKFKKRNKQKKRKIRVKVRKFKRKIRIKKQKKKLRKIKKKKIQYRIKLPKIAAKGIKIPVTYQLIYFQGEHTCIFLEKGQKRPKLPLLRALYKHRKNYSLILSENW